MFKQDLILLKRPKFLLCILDKGLICETKPAIKQHNIGHDIKTLPSYNSDISRKFHTFYNCTAVKCNQMTLDSLRKITDPDSVLIGCYKSNDCVSLRYHDMSTVDKLLFLNTNVKDKIFYTVDCLVNEKGSGICFKKGEGNSVNFKDAINTERLDVANVLSPDALICEQRKGNKEDKLVSCNKIKFIGVEEKSVKKQKLILKIGNIMAPLHQVCILNWCGYVGIINPNSSRRFTGDLFTCTKDKQTSCGMAQTKKPKYSYTESSIKIVALKAGIYGQPYNIE